MGPIEIHGTGILLYIRKKPLVVFLISAVLFFYAGCRKQRIEKHCTGTFDFTVLRCDHFFYVNGVDDVRTYDTLTFQGTIVYDKSSEILTVSYLPDRSLKCSIKKDDIHDSYHISGNNMSGSLINGNEINFNYQWYFNQYSHLTITDYVKGVKL